MIFLPIVERELRVASRKRGTFWTRTAAAIVALVIAGGFFAMTLVGFPFNAAALGKGLFATLTWLSLAVALSAGLFFTADCLSEEKREGTLGFLFLTDLHGYDVVLGKLLVTSLRGSFALLAVLPILAVTLLMGGVTGTQFWQASLALANALFVSLAAGLFVSALSRDSQKAMGATLVLIALLAAVGPAIDGIISGPRPIAGLTSPVFLFTQTGAWGRSAFWPALIANQIVAWSLLVLSCVLLPRTWQEKARKTSAARKGFEFAVRKPTAALRTKLLNVNPVLWLASRARWQAATLWTLAVVMLGLFASFLFVDENTALWFAWSYLGGILTFVVYLGMASQAGRSSWRRSAAA